MSDKTSARRKFAMSFKGTRVLTKQSFKEHCDINRIVEKSRVSGVCAHLNSRAPVFGDFSQIKSFQDATNLVMAATESFNALPSRVRERFLNDPNRLISFLGDPNNHDEAVNLGLIDPPSEPPAPVVPPPADTKAKQ